MRLNRTNVKNTYIIHIYVIIYYRYFIFQLYARHVMLNGIIFFAIFLTPLFPSSVRFTRLNYLIQILVDVKLIFLYECTQRIYVSYLLLNSNMTLHQKCI